VSSSFSLSLLYVVSSRLNAAFVPVISVRFALWLL
jgi:hypothetical protein